MIYNQNKRAFTKHYQSNLPQFQSKSFNATGKPIFYNSCEWGVEDPWTWMGQYANSWRSGPDHHDEWKSTASIIEHNADLGKYAGTCVSNSAIYIYTKCKMVFVQ